MLLSLIKSGADQDCCLVNTPISRLSVSCRLHAADWVLITLTVLLCTADLYSSLHRAAKIGSKAAKPTPGSKVRTSTPNMAQVMISPAHKASPESFDGEAFGVRVASSI